MPGCLYAQPPVHQWRLHLAGAAGPVPSSRHDCVLTCCDAQRCFACCSCPVCPAGALALRSSLTHLPACYQCAAQLYPRNLAGVHHAVHETATPPPAATRSLNPPTIPCRPPAFPVAKQLSLSPCSLGAQLTVSLQRSGQGCRPCLRVSFATQLMEPSRGGTLWSPASSHCTLSQASVWQSGVCGACRVSPDSWPATLCRRCRLQQAPGVCYPCYW